MKAFLLYSDKDFDPKQVLSQREEKIRPWHNDETLNLEQLLPWSEPILKQDLGLEVVLCTMANGDNFIKEVANVVLLNSLTESDSIFYRQNILADCIKNKIVVTELYRIMQEATQYEKDSFWSVWRSNPSGILREAIRSLEHYVIFLRKLKNIVEQHYNNFESTGFKRLFSMLREELNNEFFVEIDEHLRQLKFQDGVTLSAKLGLGNKGTDYLLHKTKVEKYNWFERLLLKKNHKYTYKLHPRDESGARFLSELRGQGINLIANALAQSTDHIQNFFNALKTELAFYVGCLNLYNKLIELNEPISFPVVVEEEKCEIKFTELYDIGLALNVNKKVIGNDLQIEDKNLIIITGANSGGKSTFLRSFGIAQLMMQAGMFVPAEKFISRIYSGIITHFRREEDVTMASGKLDEELERMNEIVEKINSKYILLFNESFSATNEREGAEIAKQIIGSLIECGVIVLYVTHNYEFANYFYKKKSKQSFFLRAQRLSDGTRTYRLIEGEPLGTSYGKDLFNKIFQNN